MGREAASHKRPFPEDEEEGRVVRKMGGGSQCKPSALAPSAERKGKCHSQTNLQAWGNPAFVSKDMADPVAEKHKPPQFCPCPCANSLCLAHHIPPWLGQNRRALQWLSLPTRFALTHNAAKEPCKTGSGNGVWPSDL